ncbi:MAG: hypothetical protein WC850_05795 [Candidatus Gracilibacteria bacterium]
MSEKDIGTYEKPEVSEEHLKTMAEGYGTIGEMTIDDFAKKIGFYKSELQQRSFFLPFIQSNDFIAELHKKREGVIISVGKYGLTMHVSEFDLRFITNRNYGIDNIKDYLIENRINIDEFKKSVLNALYINFKTPFLVDELLVTTDKTKELTTGVLEANSSTKPDKIESEEELKEKKNREIFKNVLRRKGYSDEVIDDIDKVSIFLNNDGLDFFKKQGTNQSAAAFTELYPRNIELSLEDFLKIFDLREVSYYFIRPLKFGKDIYINVVDFPVGEEEIRELTSEASSTTNPDKIESVEELREKENREIILGLLKNNYGEFINEIDFVSIKLNNEGKVFFKQSLDPMIQSLALTNLPVLLSFKDFCKTFDFSKLPCKYFDPLIILKDSQQSRLNLVLKNIK